MTTVYDEIPYANLPFAQARPSVFATVAALHGLTPPDPRSARVLELGCGAGANLAGIAAANPEATAVGVDLAASAVAEGRETAAAAGLGNLRFEVGDVLALTDGELGEFDYVIAHGLYSWVDVPAREATLAACRSHLAADGIAYVSYTAHPGGHLRRMLREAAEWHARGLDDLVERAERSRQLFGLLDRIQQSDGPSFYGGVLGRGTARARHRAGADARPRPAVGELRARVVQGLRRRRRRATGWPTSATRLPASSRRPAWTEGVDAFVDDAAGEDRVAHEQYFDLLVLRRFRHSLLCRDEQRPTREVDRAALQRMLVEENGRGARFRSRRCASAAARAPGSSPRRWSADFDEGNVSFHAVPSPAARVAGERPVASALARSQARPGAIVTTLENHVVRINDEPTAALLGLLDGTRDRAAIRDAFPGELTEESLEAALAKLAELGLLVA